MKGYKGNNKCDSYGKFGSDGVVMGSYLPMNI